MTTSTKTTIGWADVHPPVIHELLRYLTANTMPGHDIMSKEFITTMVDEVTVTLLNPGRDTDAESRLAAGQGEEQRIINGCIAASVLMAVSVTRHTSNLDNPKETITTNGEIQEHMDGLYTLSLIQRIQQDVGAESSHKMGRGTAAHDLIANIHSKLRETDDYDSVNEDS